MLKYCGGIIVIFGATNKLRNLVYTFYRVTIIIPAGG